MKTVVYSARKFETGFLNEANGGRHELRLVALPLCADTLHLAEGAGAVSLFVSDDGSAPIIEGLAALGVRFIALRSAGFNHVSIPTAAEHGIRVSRVAAYSPYAIAEHAVALMMALNRKLIRANSRVHELNFTLDGLMGFDMHGKTAGIIGTGYIGAALASILHGFGCRLLAVDPAPDAALVSKYGLSYVDADTLFSTADIISLHAPLTADTHYMINAETIGRMKPGVMLINTSRGGLVDTKAVIAGLKSGQIGYLGLDVYEEEAGLFFDDHSDEVLQDDTISRLLSFKNVLITSHQAFLTDTALAHIAASTISNLDCLEQGLSCANEIIFQPQAGLKP